MAWIQGKGWLIVGLALGLLVPALQLHRSLPAALARWLPLPWSELLVGVLVFLACAGLYFRSHWAATARAAAAHGDAVADATASLKDLAADIERSGTVMSDNLAEVARDPQGPTSELYLQGAQSHAERLGILAGRLRALVASLSRREHS